MHGSCNNLFSFISSLDCRKAVTLTNINTNTTLTKRFHPFLFVNTKDEQ